MATKAKEEWGVTHFKEAVPVCAEKPGGTPPLTRSTGLSKTALNVS